MKYHTHKVTWKIEGDELVISCPKVASSPSMQGRLEEAMKENILEHIASNVTKEDL